MPRGSICGKFITHKVLAKPRRKQNNREPQVQTNDQIRVREMRVISDDGNNYGIISKDEALKIARDSELDLILISPTAKPPVAKIMDYGKFLYSEKKKQKAAKAKSHNVEVKSIQVKVGTGEGDLNIKAKKASKWLEEGHRIKVELFLPGRTKYMEKGFLQERLERLLKLLTVDYVVAEEARKNPKGMAMIIEKKR